MLPEGWRRRNIKQCADLLTGFAFTSEKYVESTQQSVRLLRGDNVSQGTLRWDDAKRWLVPYPTTLDRYEMKIGDIVIAMDRPITKAGLKCSMVGKNDIPCLLVQRVARLRAIPAFDQGYVSHVLQSHAFIQHLLGQKTETAVPHISPDDIRDFEFMCPESLHEQRRIACMLTTWDKAIATLARLHSNSWTQRQALLAATLHLAPANPEANSAGDNGGFPPSVQAGIPDLPETPKGWRRLPLGRHLSEVRRPVLLLPDQDYRLVTVKRSRGGVCMREVLPGRDVKTPTQSHVRAGDFLISKRQIVHGACGLVPPELDGAVVSNEYAVLNTDGAIDLKFLRYLSETRYFQQTCFHSSIGVHVEKMIFKTERWLKWPFNIPPLEAQRRIVEVLDIACREIELIAAQVASLKQEKAALMSQLLTGKRRVRLSEPEAGFAS
jgi:type I restriction enzyme, S subunit